MQSYFAILVLLVVYAVHPVAALQQDDVKVDISVEPLPKPGTPSELRILVSNAATAERITNVKIAMEIAIPSEELVLFSGEFYSPDGLLRLTYHFQDASEHAINLKISPTELSSAQFEPVAKTFPIGVELPDPPTKIWFKTWLFLMGTMVLGIGIGFFAIKYLNSNAASDE